MTYKGLGAASLKFFRLSIQYFSSLLGHIMNFVRTRKSAESHNMLYSSSPIDLKKS